MSSPSSRENDSTRARTQPFPFLQLPAEVQLEILRQLVHPWSIRVKKDSQAVVTEDRMNLKPYKLTGPGRDLYPLLSVSKHFAALLRLLIRQNFTGHVSLGKTSLEKLVAQEGFGRTSLNEFKSYIFLLQGKCINIDWVVSEVGRSYFPHVKAIDNPELLTEYGYLVSNDEVLDVGILGFLAGAADDRFTRRTACTHWLGTEEELSSPEALRQCVIRKILYVQDAIFTQRTWRESVGYAWPGDVLVSLPSHDIAYSRRLTE